MSQRSMPKLIRIFSLTALAVVLWLSYGYASAYGMFGLAFIPLAINAGAAIATAALVVILAAQLSLRFGVARVTRAEPTGLHHALVYGAFSFAAAALVLAHLGVNITAVLTTSAIATVLIGLALQPTFASVLAGLTVDRVVRVGDGVLLNNEEIEITSLNWRSAVGRGANGSTVIVPNTQLVAATLTILAQDAPVTVQIALPLPVCVPPHRVRETLERVLQDVPEIDNWRPIMLYPESAGTGGNSTTYRASFVIRHYRRRRQVEAEVMSRLWYALRREKLAPADSDTPAADQRALVDAALRAASARRRLPPEWPDDPQALLEAGEILRYGDGEPIALPERLAGSACLLIDGEIARGEDQDASLRTRLPRSEALAQVERSLAWQIGPYAEVAVRRAATAGTPVRDVGNLVAAEIDDAEARRTFLHETDLPEESLHVRGFFLAAGGTARALGDTAPMWASGYAMILAVPTTARA